MARQISTDGPGEGAKALLGQVKLFECGAALDGDPQPGGYYGVAAAADGADARTIAGHLKQAFPLSHFTAIAMKGAQ